MAVPVTQDIYDMLTSIRLSFAQARDVSLGQAAQAQRDAALSDQRVGLLDSILADLTVPDGPPAVMPPATR